MTEDNIVTDFDINAIPERVQILMDAYTAARGLRQSQKSLLTPRQIQVANCVAHGLSIRQIGNKLAIGLDTVYTHLNSCYVKLNIDSTTSKIHGRHLRPRALLIALFNVPSQEPVDFKVLSLSQRRVINAIAEGHTLKKVAKKMRLSGETIKTHLHVARQKLGSISRHKIIALYLAAYPTLQERKAYIAAGSPKAQRPARKKNAAVPRSLYPDASL